MKVHTGLGAGFPEIIYQRALKVELSDNNISFGREIEIPVFYKNIQVGARRVDFLVDDKVLVEIKATSELNDLHYAQIINYLEAFRLEVGLLINFGEKSLRFKRFINTIKQESA